MSNKYFVHFHVKLLMNKLNKLEKENYCTIPTSIEYDDRKIIEKCHECYIKNGRYPLLVSKYYYEFPNDVFLNEREYNPKFLENKYNDIMENFKLNMDYFNHLDKNKFNKILYKFLKKYKFIECDDLNEVKEVSGIYILVLDEYKQVYIGKAENIKRRIMSHWSSKKNFTRLLFGNKENSKISIDSFGALDTTRIFYKNESYYSDLDKIEKKLVDEFDDAYLLNRTGGGFNSSEYLSFNKILVSANKKTRDFIKK